MGMGTAVIGTGWGWVQRLSSDGVGMGLCSWARAGWGSVSVPMQTSTEKRPGRSMLLFDAAGMIETGLFINLATRAYFGNEVGQVVCRLPRQKQAVNGEHS